ncbi:MAG TPA: thioredoxin reductase, partial [Clostridiales bacterium]|nr:thioredoxin reductase [Clostridiales bacterium]
MERYDIAIIGTGPAGLSAAITAVIRKKRVVLFGSRSLSDKVEKAHTIQNYLGLPSISGQNLQKAFLRHLDEMQIAVTEERVTLVYPMGDYFALQ